MLLFTVIFSLYSDLVLGIPQGQTQDYVTVLSNDGGKVSRAATHFISMFFPMINNTDNGIAEYGRISQWI